MVLREDIKPHASHSKRNRFSLLALKIIWAVFQQQLIRPWDLGDGLQEEEKEKRPRRQKNMMLSELPEWMRKDIELQPIEMHVLAGYVVYKKESGREDGFLVYLNDEETF